LRLFLAEPTAEADWGRHPGFASFNVFAGGPGSLALQRYLDLGVHLLRLFFFRLRGRGFFRVLATTGLFRLDKRAARLRSW
jgi:hypothetical protein